MNAQVSLRNSWCWHVNFLHGVIINTMFKSTESAVWENMEYCSIFAQIRIPDRISAEYSFIQHHTLCSIKCSSSEIISQRPTSLYSRIKCGKSITESLFRRNFINRKIVKKNKKTLLSIVFLFYNLVLPLTQMINAWQKRK